MTTRFQTHPFPALPLRACQVAITGFLAFGSAAVFADIVTWANNASSTNWNEAASWTGGGVPGAEDVASVPKGGARPALEAGQSAAVRGIQLFCKDSNKCHIHGTGTISLGADGLSITVESGSGGTGGDIYPNFVLTTDQTWNIGGPDSGSNSSFSLRGGIGEDDTPRALTFSGGKGVVYMYSAGSTFSGGFACLSGILRLEAGSTLDGEGRIQSGVLGIGPVTFGNISITDKGKTIYNPVTIAGNLTFARDGQTGKQTMTIAPTTDAAPSASVLYSETNGVQHVITLHNDRLKLAISQSLGESGAEKLGFVVQAGTGKGSNSSGQMILSGTTPNTFTGTVTVNGASLRLAKSANVSAIPAGLELNGGTLSLGAAEQISDDSIVRVNTANSPVVSFEKSTTETIRQLWVDGVRWEDGVYTSDNASFLSGSGVLVVKDPTLPTVLIVK